jgi:hypothetical protein
MATKSLITETKTFSKVSTLFFHSSPFSLEGAKFYVCGADRKYAGVKNSDGKFIYCYYSVVIC